MTTAWETMNAPLDTLCVPKSLEMPVRVATENVGLRRSSEIKEQRLDKGRLHTPAIDSWPELDNDRICKLVMQHLRASVGPSLGRTTRRKLHGTKGTPANVEVLL
mmetsp:Transcript_96140/g.280853  ORF Transcript_96140/g.280853 Transcript_96140/m.280853 type:complete len:105 (+) Transcript_96140:98-412(+)